MPRVRPLTPDQARNTLAARIGARIAPKVRQFATKFGVRPYRVFLVWTKWTGTERGEGDLHEVRRVEVLPTPRVQSLDSVTFSLLQAGTVPVGSLRVDQISTGTFSADLLQGVAGMPGGERIPEPYDFFYEVVEDGRADNPPHRAKFRLMNVPFLRPGKVDWTIMLERIGQDLNRDGTPATDQGTQG